MSKLASNYTHIITKTQFLIQLAPTCTLHWAQGLTIDYLAFDLTRIYKHVSTFSHITKKENLDLLQLLQMKIFKIVRNVAFEMHWLQTITQWDVLIPKPHTLWNSHVLICFLILDHYLWIKVMSLWIKNLKTSDILCLNETNFNPKISNKLHCSLIQKNSNIIYIWAKWHNDNIWQCHNIIITWNIYQFGS